LRVLIVDDDAESARRLQTELRRHLGPTTVVPDAYQALSRHSDEPYDVVILEVALPGASGIDLLERMVPSVPAVVLTWLVSPAVTARARQAGAHAVVSKPCEVADVVATVRAAVSRETRARYVTV